MFLRYARTLLTAVLVTVFAEGFVPHGLDFPGRLRIADDADLRHPEGAVARGDGKEVAAARSRNSVPEVIATRRRAASYHPAEETSRWLVLQDDATWRDGHDSSILDIAVARKGRRLQRPVVTPAPIPTPPVPTWPSLPEPTNPPAREPPWRPNSEQTVPPTSWQAPQPTPPSSEAISTVAPTRIPRNSRTREPVSVTPAPTAISTVAPTRIPRNSRTREPISVTPAPTGAFASPTQQPGEEAVLVQPQAPTVRTAAPTSAPSSSMSTFSPTTGAPTSAPSSSFSTFFPTTATARTPGPTTIVSTANRPGTVAAGVMSILIVVGVVFLSAGSLMKVHQGGSVSRASPKTLRGIAGMDGALAPVGERINGQVLPPNSTKHRPAATLAFVLVTQLQFLAMLSLVEYATSYEDSLLADFVVGLRWVNLWWPMDIPEDNGSGGCVFSAGVGEIGASVFVGNTVLVVGILLGMFLLHIAVVSGVEAYWMAEKRAKALIEASSRPAPPANMTRPVRFASEKVLRRTAPGNPPSYRAPTNVGSLGDLTPVREESDYEESDPSSSRSSSSSSCSSEDHQEGVRPTRIGNRSGEKDARVGGRLEASLSNEDGLDPVATCRKHFASVWVYFPHLQLVFLFFAFGGAVASQAAALRSATCPMISISAGLALLLYPALLLGAVWRIVVVRVRPGVVLSFKRYRSEDDTNSFNPEDGKNNSMSAFRSTWKNDSGVFSWADKGQWETVQHRPDSEEANWFRIGFEPVFSSYTKSGVWFVVISLVERAAVACVVVFIDNSITQLLLLCAMHMLMCAILMLFKPFVNRMVNFICICAVVINVFSMGLLAMSAHAWEGTGNAKATNTTFVVLQIFLLCALAIPIYVDAVAVVTRAVHNAVQRTRTDKSRLDELEGNREEKKERQAYIRSFARRQWCRTWCAMVRHNVFACARDTREGLRRPRNPTAARSGPYPAPDPLKTSSGTSEQAHGPRGVVGTANLPVFVPNPDRCRMAESGSSDNATSSEAVSSGRTIIQHGASGHETVPSFADYLKGRDAPNEYSGHYVPEGEYPSSERGDMSVGGSPRLEHSKLVPENRPSIEIGVASNRDALSVSSGDFSSNASSSRNLLARGKEASRREELHGIPATGDRGVWRVMGMSGMFTRRPPTESTVPRRTEWRGVGRQDLKSSGTNDEVERQDPERSDEGKTESRENYTAGVFGRTSLGARNVTKTDTGTSSSAFVNGLPIEFSSKTADEPDESHAEGKRGGGAESDEEHPRGSSRIPWGARKTPVETDIPRRRSSNYGGLNADGSSSFELPRDPEKGKPTNAVGANEAENLESGRKVNAYAHLEFTGAWDSDAGSAAVAHAAENLEWGKEASDFADLQHAREERGSAAADAHLDEPRPAPVAPVGTEPPTDRYSN